MNNWLYFKSNHTFVIKLLLYFFILTFYATASNSYADVSLTMTASPDPVMPGERIYYTITVSNQGSVALTNVELSDLVPDHTRTSGSEVTGGGSCSSYAPTTCYAGDEVKWTLGSLEPGDAYTVQMAALVDSGSSAPADGTVIHNSVTVSFDGGSVAYSTARGVVVDSAPELMLSLVDDRDPVEPGAELTYTLTYGNRGGVSVSDVVLSSLVPVGTAFVSAGDGGSVVDGLVQWNIGLLSAGDSGQRQFTVQVDGGAAEGSVLLSDAEIRDSVSSQSFA